jgi:hypothetical protein
MLHQNVKLVVAGFGLIAALSLACSHSSSPSPTTPTSLTGAGAAATGPDGSTLKVPAPTLVSPLNDAKLDDAPTLVANEVKLKFASSGCTIQYQFEVYDANNNKVVDDTQPTPSDAVTLLSFETRHTWRVRATCTTAHGQVYGPWSSVGSFISPTGGYIRGAEVYDPLTNGKTVGQINGPVTFIPGQGVRLETESSWITYNLGAPPITGEFSMLVSGLRTVSAVEDPKNSIMFMAEPRGESFNENRYRMSVDVRGNGAIAWRFITGTSQYIQTFSSERKIYPFHESLLYFVKATWDGGRFNVLFQEGGVGGKTIYDFGKGYGGVYRPSPPAAYLGRPFQPGTRDSPASYDGAVIRQVWLSNRPRPDSVNK